MDSDAALWAMISASSALRDAKTERCSSISRSPAPITSSSTATFVADGGGDGAPPPLAAASACSTSTLACSCCFSLCSLSSCWFSSAILFRSSVPSTFTLVISCGRSWLATCLARSSRKLVTYPARTSSFCLRSAASLSASFRRPSSSPTLCSESCWDL